jgi:hypothetical protein
MFTVTVKSNVSLSPGDALILLTNGTVDIAVAASTYIYGVCQSKITAIAATRQNVQMIPALENIVWEAQYGTSAVAFTNITVSRSIAGGTGVMRLTNVTTYSNARIVGLSQAPDNALGQYMRVLFVWNKSSWSGQA